MALSAKSGSTQNMAFFLKLCLNAKKKKMAEALIGALVQRTIS